MKKQAPLGSLTIDVEEYFQVEAFADNVSFEQWDCFESRVEYQIDLLLEKLEFSGVKATFFILGFVAKRHPELIKKLGAAGHEIGSHGFNHCHLTKMSQAEFEEDITDSKKILEDITGEAVIGYRAPCFSISSDNGWAHDTILGAGYQYSSSSYPIQHDLYGVPNAPRTPYRLSNGLLEIPVSTWNFLNKQLPAGGGGYFRLLPYQLFKCILRKSSEQLGVFNFYTHPWEFDPEQPKISASHKSQFRHYVNQSTALSKFAKLCHDFEFDTIANVHLGKNYPVLGKWTEVSRGNYES